MTAQAQVAKAPEFISSDRFLLKVVDRAITIQDISYQLRNLNALNCIYSDALVVSYFEKSFLKELDTFIKGLPKEDAEVSKYLHHKDSLKTNFKSLIEMELYLRSRYEGQLKSSKRNFDFIRPSIDLFVESLDKQFLHEYYW